MSASKILERLQKKGQISSVAPTNSNSNGSNNLQNRPGFRPSSNTPPSERPVDPVVARLKAARKAEREQKERELREKKGLKPKPSVLSKPRIGPRQPGNPPHQAARSSGNRVNNQIKPRAGTNSSPKRPLSSSSHISNVQADKKPKMSFSQLMAKASGIDQSKMSIAIKQKTKSPEASGNVSRRRTPDHERSASTGNKPQNTGKDKRGIRPSERARPSGSSNVSLSSRAPQTQPQHVQSRAPLPMRKPSSALAQKLKQKPGSKGQKSSKKRAGYNSDDQEDEEEGEESDDMDSFIASEDEEVEEDEPDYDRDEIWSIFNRGKKRSHYSYDDYDSDDMEATGAEILEEESRSKRNALLEDKREMEKEAKLAAMKRARKSGLKR